MRGRHRSRPPVSVLSEIRALVAEGVKEINLISQDTTYYGMDLWAAKAGPRQPVDSSRGPTLAGLLGGGQGARHQERDWEVLRREREREPGQREEDGGHPDRLSDPDGALEARRPHRAERRADPEAGEYDPDEERRHVQRALHVEHADGEDHLAEVVRRAGAHRDPA